jgi:hypothetical protein
LSTAAGVHEKKGRSAFQVWGCWTGNPLSSPCPVEVHAAGSRHPADQSKTPTISTWHGHTASFEPASLQILLWACICFHKRGDEWKTVPAPHYEVFGDPGRHVRNCRQHCSTSTITKVDL